MGPERAINRKPRWAIAMIAASLALAACGGGSARTSTGSDATYTHELAAARCMRAHGVPSFPDPQGSNGFEALRPPGSPSTSVNGIPFSGPAFNAAVATCKPFGAGFYYSMPEKERVFDLAFAACVRHNGVPNLPDPQFPTSGGVSYYQPLPPGINPMSPAWKHAMATCHRRMHF